MEKLDPILEASKRINRKRAKRQIVISIFCILFICIIAFFFFESDINFLPASRSEKKGIGLLIALILGSFLYSIILFISGIFNFRKNVSENSFFDRVDEEAINKMEKEVLSAEDELDKMIEKKKAKKKHAENYEDEEDDDDRTHHSFRARTNYEEATKNMYNERRNLL